MRQPSSNSRLRRLCSSSSFGNPGHNHWNRWTVDRANVTAQQKANRVHATVHYFALLGSMSEYGKVRQRWEVDVLGNATPLGFHIVSEAQPASHPIDDVLTERSHLSLPRRVVSEDEDIVFWSGVAVDDR